MSKSLVLSCFTHQVQNFSSTVGTNWWSWFDLVSSHLLLKITFVQNALLSNLTTNKSLQKVIRDQILIFKEGDMWTNQCFLIFEDSNCSKNFYPGTFFILKVSQLGWNLMFSFLIEDNFLHTGSIINFKNGSHVFLVLIEQLANHNDGVDVLAIKLTFVIWTSTNISNHF